MLEETRQMDKLLDAYERMHKKEKNDHLNDIVDAGVRPVLLKQVVHQEKLDEERQARILREKEIITNRIESRKQRLHEEQHLSMQRKKLRNDMAVVIQQFFIGAIRRKQMKHNILLRKSCTKIQAQIRTCLARTIVNNRIAEIENTKKQERDAIAAKNRKIRDAMALKLKCEQDALDSAELYMKSTKDLLDIIHIAIARQVKHKQCIESVYMKFTNEFGIIDRLSFRCTLGKLGILASRGDIRKVMRLMLSKLPNIENHRLTLSIKEFTTIFDLNIDVDDVASSISSANSKFLDDSYNEGFIDSGIILPALPILRRMKESIQESIRNKFELNLTGRTEYSIVEVFDMVETTWNSPQLDYLHFSKFIHSYDPSFNRNEIAQLTTIFDETLSGTISTNGFLKFILADYKTSNNTSLYPLITVKLRTVLLNTLQNGQDMSTTIDQILLAADTDTVSANHLLLGFQGLHIPFSTLEVVQFLLHFEVKFSQPTSFTLPLLECKFTIFMPPNKILALTIGGNFLKLLSAFDLSR